jgi:hypothetical protein
MDYRNIITDFLVKEKIFLENRKKLIVLLGSFADFDSFEYSQQLSAKSNWLAKHSVDLILIGIGSEKSKESFCKFNKIDINNVIAVKNADLHEKLNLNAGLVTQMPAIINLLIMCTGINSRGTIKEVLRGYFGDKNARSLFAFDEDINLGPFSLLKGSMFDIATRRFMNMIEILSNWNTYVPDSAFLTQRGATIRLNEKDEVLYEFISESLLGYSSKMSAPLSFLDDTLN